MPRSIPYSFVLLCSLLLYSCSSVTPEKCFGIAVLNSNMMTGFANSGLSRELESPSVKMGKTKDEIMPMQRKEVIGSKISFVEENFEKLKGIKETDDTKEILQASLALHEFILPVLKTEYTALAKLYDSGAPKQEIERMDQDIHDRYFQKFEELYTRLINSGKSYAARHNIQVRWNS